MVYRFDNSGHMSRDVASYEMPFRCEGIDGVMQESIYDAFKRYSHDGGLFEPFKAGLKELSEKDGPYSAFLEKLLSGGGTAAAADQPKECAEFAKFYCDYESVLGKQAIGVKLLLGALFGVGIQGLGGDALLLNKIPNIYERLYDTDIADFMEERHKSAFAGIAQVCSVSADERVMLSLYNFSIKGALSRGGINEPDGLSSSRIAKYRAKVSKQYVQESVKLYKRVSKLEDKLIAKAAKNELYAAMLEGVIDYPLEGLDRETVATRDGKRTYRNARKNGTLIANRLFVGYGKNTKYGKKLLAMTAAAEACAKKYRHEWNALVDLVQ